MIINPMTRLKKSGLHSVQEGAEKFVCSRSTVVTFIVAMFQHMDRQLVDQRIDNSDLRPLGTSNIPGK